MFGFSFEEMESTGSAERFPIRVEKFRKKKKFLPVVQHYLWWFLHNFITHPLIGLLPFKPFFQFHDWSSVKLNAGQAATLTEIEELKNCKKHLEKTLEVLKGLNGGEDSLESYYIEQGIEVIESSIQSAYTPSRRPRRKQIINTLPIFNQQ